MTDDADTGLDSDRRGRRRRPALAERNPGLADGLHAGFTAALCLILLWAPIPLGSNRPLYLSLLALLVGTLLAAWSVAAATGAIRTSRRVISLWPAAAAFILAMAIAGIQIVDLRQVDALIGTSFARDLAHPIWQLAGESLGKTLPAYISVNPAKADPAFVKSFVYASVFFLAFILARQTWSARALLTFVAASGAVCVAISFIQMSFGFNVAEWLTDEILNDSGTPASERDRFVGTFTNPNHMATFAGVALIAAAGLVYEAINNGVVLKRGRDIAVRTAVATFLGPALPVLAFAILLSSAVVMTASRAGAVSVMAGCIVLAGILLLVSRSRSGSAAGPWVLGLAGAALVAGVAFASAPMVSRLAGQGFKDTMRFDIALATADAVAAAPATGNGFGAFIDYYPLYAREAERATINKAHNDYLEALSDLGVVGGLAMIFAPAYLVFLAARGIFRRRRGRAFGAVAVGAATICAVHALFDFSLQIPAVGLLFYTALGAGVAQAWRGEDEDAGDPRMSA